MLAVVFYYFGYTVTWSGISEDEGAPAGQGASAPAESAAPQQDAAAAPPPRWLISMDGQPMYTVILGLADSGPVTVEASGATTGTYEWSGDTLSIEFTRIWAQDDGGSVADPWTFECTGSPEADELACVGTSYKWAYLGQGQVDMRELLTFDVVATRD